MFAFIRRKWAAYWAAVNAPRDDDDTNFWGA
jgi:hypothetical protein